MTFDDTMKKFRLAGRELFNQYFYLPEPQEDGDLAWQSEENFSEVEKVLFQKLVLEPASLPLIEYKNLQSSIRVELAGEIEFAPIMLNREIKSGYWDFPVKEVTRDAVLLFIQFFDWSSYSYRDNQYVRVQVGSWTSHPETVGKHALLQTNNVRFTITSTTRT